MLTKDQRKELKEAAKPLVKFLNENCNPHCYVIVEQDGVELTEAVTSVSIDEFIKD